MIAGSTTLSITGGKVDEEKSLLRFTESAGWVYVGRIIQDKGVNGTVTKSPLVHYFRMSYNA